MDEVPCNSDFGHPNFLWGRSSSGDWKGLNSNGVNLMMALKPVEDESRGIFTALADTILSRETGVDLCFPEDIVQLKLQRIFRCTQNITQFYEMVFKSLNKNFINYSTNVNSSSISYSPGHEIYGEPPEILLLPQCNCFN